MEIAARLSHISKDFPMGDETIRVLHDISVKVLMGELTMLIGPSGCGKTTLLSIISGILAPTRGSVEVTGLSLNHMEDAEKVLFRRRSIGFIFQQYNLLPALTAAENASLPLIAAGVADEDATEQARHLLADLDMATHADKLPRQLSGGQQQRVAIVRALIHKPKLIVCDEPTAALDAKSGHAVMEILRHIANDPQRSVLLVTHDSRIYTFGDRILEMSDGRLVGDAPAKVMTGQEQR